MTAHRTTLLIIDDDPDLRGAIAEQLELEGFATLEAATAEEGVRCALAQHPDLILLDVALPDMNGTAVCRELRGTGVAAPIIMLSAAAAESAMIEALEAGANDYVTKPYQLAVLLARIRAQLRSHERSADAVFHIGAFEFRPGSKILIDAKQRKIRLTEKETNILKYLYLAREQPVSREELLAHVWGYGDGITTHTLETHIYRLRQKIEADPANASLLLTDAGGYRLYTS